MTFAVPATPKMPAATTNPLVPRTAQLDRSGGGGGKQQPKAKHRRQSEATPATPSSSTATSPPFAPTPAAAGTASRPAAAAAAVTMRQRVRHSTGAAGARSSIRSGSGSSPLSILHAAAATQERLDRRRKEIEAAVTGSGAPAAAGAGGGGGGTARVHPVVASAVAQMLRSLHSDRETARVCMKGLLIGDVACNAKTLARAQESQQQLLDRCVDALGFSQLVGRIEQYLRDRNLPRGTSSYCLDQGWAGSWARIRTAKLDLLIPPEAAATMGGAFSACALEVTTQVPLASVGRDIRSLHRLFQPLTAKILAAGPAPGSGGGGGAGGGRELQLVIEVATAAAAAATTTGAAAAAGGGGTPFLIEAYGYRTAFGQAALDADDALLRAWAGSVPPPRSSATAAAAAPPAAAAAAAAAAATAASSSRCPSTRHVLGLQITLPHPLLLAPGFVKAPLTVLLSVR